MKNKIKILSLIAIVFVHSISGVSAKTYQSPMITNNREIVAIEDLIQTTEFIEERNTYLEKYYGSDFEYKLELNAIAVESAKKIESLFNKNEQGKVSYPNYIGGLYIDNNNNLVIQVVDNNTPQNTDDDYEIFNKILDVDKSSIIEYVKYSYENLNAINEIIINYINNNKVSENIVGFYIDVISNKVIVELNKKTNEEIENFKKNIIDSNAIEFVEVEKNVDEASLYAGGKLSFSSSSWCSYGYRARINSSRVGMVTAGHCFDGIGDGLSGVGTVNKYQYSGSVDAAWLETTSSNTPINTLAVTPTFDNTNTLATNVMTSFVVGQALGKVGATTGYTSGSVVSASYSTLGFTNLVKTNFNSDPGDSGGIVFANTATLNGFATAGIVKGGPIDGVGMFFSRADYINSALGLSRY